MHINRYSAQTILISLISLVLLLLVGCQYNPHAHTYTTHKPSVEEITGDYELSENWMEHYSPGIKDKIKALPQPPLIHINANGDFNTINFPNYTVDSTGFKYTFEGFIDFKGKWEITKVGGVDNGWGHAKDHYGIELNHYQGQISYAGFTGTKKVDGIIFGFGDPDSGDAIIFKKKIPKNSK